MKKIGIITIPDYDNYGNRLQNYAVRKFFLDLGHQVDTLELNDKDFSQYKARKIKLLLKKRKLNFIVHLFERMDGGKQKVKRYKKFEEFTYSHLSPKYHPNGELTYLQKTADNYDYIVLGSDQIWHPTVNTTPNLFFATFARPEKVLFFAPSFGIEELSEEYALSVKKNLSDKDNLTVREETGRKLIFDLIGKESEVLPDPTLCIKPEDWKSVAVRPEGVGDKKYILKYFLGSESEAYKKAVDEVCKEYKTDIFQIAAPSVPSGYTTGPKEFLGSILNAEYVVTDSFHAVVFCIIFKKPFTVFSRLNDKGENEGLDSRIDILLKKFSLEDRKFSQDKDIGICELKTENLDNVLNKERQCALDFFGRVIKEKT